MEKKSIIFDFFGVLFYFRIQPILKEVGIGGLLWYTLRHRQTPFTRFFSLLDKMRKEVPGEFQEQVTYGGYYLPNSICSWQRGQLTSQQMLDRLVQYIKKLHKTGYIKTEQELLLITKAMTAAFDPQQLIKACELNRSAADAARGLKKKYQLYALSNVDKELYGQLERQYGDFFSLFNGIVTSYESNWLKPEPEIYLYLVDQYQLNPNDCCFIDDQKENILAAQAVGMKGILYKKGENIVKRVQKVW